MAAATAISPSSNRRHLVAAIFPSTYSLCQVAYSKLLTRHISEQYNLTIGLGVNVNCNSRSLDWGSALNSSTVLGDLSDSSSPRTSSDWFFKE